MRPTRWRPSLRGGQAGLRHFRSIQAKSRRSDTGGVDVSAEQSDGNLVLYSEKNDLLWASSSAPVQDRAFSGPTRGLDCADCYADFQPDGNLVLYRPDPSGAGKKAYWATNTAGNDGARFLINSRSLIAIVGRDGSVLWSAGAAPPAPRKAESAAQTGSVYDRQMDQLWRRTARFVPFLNFQIETVPDRGRPFPNGMDQGTQIVPHDGAWYLFNRENDLSPFRRSANTIPGLLSGRAWIAGVHGRTRWSSQSRSSSGVNVA